MSRHSRIFFIWCILVLSFDQLTKVWAVRNNWSTLNLGISFGFFQHAPVILVLLITMLVAGMVLAILIKKHLPAWWWGIFVGAVLSNMLDRVFRGGVIDWMPIPIIHIQNNSADWFIFFCLFWLFIKEYRTIRT